MRDILKKADIDQVQQDLRHRRREILARHAEESRVVDAERAELETLNHLIELFTQKFTSSVAVAREPVAAPVANQDTGSKTAAASVAVAREPVVAPAANQDIRDKAEPAARNHHPRANHVSNFAVYTRALARA